MIGYSSRLASVVLLLCLILLTNAIIAPANHTTVIARLSPDVRNGTYPLTVTFGIQASPSSDSICSPDIVNLDFGDGISISGDSSSLQSAIHTYFIPGTFNAVLSFSMEANHGGVAPNCQQGSASDSSVIQVDPDDPLIAIISGETEFGFPPVESLFDASLSTTDTFCLPIFNHQWRLGEDKTAIGQIIEPNLTDSGIQLVTLNIQDSCGRQSSHSTLIFVADPEFMGELAEPHALTEEDEPIRVPLETSYDSILDIQGDLEELLGDPANNSGITVLLNDIKQKLERTISMLNEVSDLPAISKAVLKTHILDEVDSLRRLENEIDEAIDGNGNEPAEDSESRIRDAYEDLTSENRHWFSWHGQPLADIYTCYGYWATILGTNGSDIFNGVIGTDGPDVINGLNGSDFIYGLGGDDFICGGPGNDNIQGGPGEDTIMGDEGDDKIYGNEGGRWLHGGEGNDEIHGGSAYQEFLNGGPGDDKLYGYDGHDLLYGGSGWDLLDGGPGDDEIMGHEGTDTIYGRAGKNRMNGGPDGDLIYGGNEIDFIAGGSGDDFLRGNSGNDVLGGGEGKDKIQGDAGDDKLYGDEDDDWLIGGAQWDVCDGGSGKDFPDSSCEHQISLEGP
jgi:hypothetical protein